MTALLDTNIVVPILAGDPQLAARISSISVALSAIVLGELDYGAKKSSRVQHNLERVDRFLAAVQVLPVDSTTAQAYGDIKAALTRKGRPIPDNDIWIAATAIQNNLTLITRDAHFAQVDGLRTELW